MNLPIPFRHSIQLRLAAALSAALLLAALLAGGFAFYDSYRSTNKLQDDLLRQIAAHIDPNRLPENTESQRDAHIRIQTPAGERARIRDSDDDDDHITLPANLPEGLHTFQEPDGDDTYRAYIRHTPQGPVAVLQENDFREDMAERAAWSSALPLILLAPLSILLTIFIVRRTMQPVHRLSQSLEARRSSDLAPLSTKNIPNEINIIWNEACTVAALDINGYIHALFDFNRHAGYCRNASPEAYGDWLQDDNRLLSDELLDQYLPDTE